MPDIKTRSEYWWAKFKDKTEPALVYFIGDEVLVQRISRQPFSVPPDKTAGVLIEQIMPIGARERHRKLADKIEAVAPAIRQGMADIVASTHASVVVTSAAILEYELERCIKTKSGTLGGASTFSAKIDRAHALDITSTEINEELNKVREIRNEFSHSKTVLTLNSDDIRPMVDDLRVIEKTGAPLDDFLKHVVMINDYLERFLAGMGVTDNISERNLPRQ